MESEQDARGDIVTADRFFMSDKINEIAGALAKAQGEMGGAKKGAQNPHLRNKYADLASVMDALKEPLSSNGLALTQLVENEGENVAVRTLLVHSSGQWFMSRIVLPYSANKGVNEAQAMGSVITYMRRYQASGITGLHQEDDDAASAKDTKPFSEPKPDPIKAPQPTGDKVPPVMEGTVDTPKEAGDISEPQIKKLHAMLGGLGIKDEYEKHIKASKILGFKDVVESFTYLTKENAETLYKSILIEQQAGREPEQEG